ncbi:MAG: hypothetical protein WD018_09210 [Nitrosopumilaceae archaeon]
MASQNKREYKLAPDLQISRVLNGMWQVAGAHGYIDPTSVIDSMMNYNQERNLIRKKKRRYNDVYKRRYREK